jgi:hypothetical protein
MDSLTPTAMATKTSSSSRAVGRTPRSSRICWTKANWQSLRKTHCSWHWHHRGNTQARSAWEATSGLLSAACAMRNASPNLAGRTQIFVSDASGIRDADHDCAAHGWDRWCRRQFYKTVPRSDDRATNQKIASRDNPRSAICHLRTPRRSVGCRRSLAGPRQPVQNRRSYAASPK